MSTDTADRMSVKDFLARRWKVHKDAYRAGNFEEADGAFGFVVVDRYVTPPDVCALLVQADGRVRGVRAALPDDAAARQDLAAIGRAAMAAPESKTLGVGEALAMLGLTGDGASPLAQHSVQRFAEGLGDARVAARLPLADLTKAEVKRFEETGLARIRASFNRDALRVLGAVENFLWRDYLYYADPDKGAIRRQAAELYPLLATEFVARPSIKGAIDRSEPLVDAIQKAYGEDENGKPHLPKAVISRLRGVTWPTGGIRPDRIAYALSEIPADWFPKTREEWDAFCDIHATVGTVLRDATGLGADVLYNGCGGKWVEFRERLAKAFTDVRPPEGLEADPPAWLSGAALKAVQSGFDWKAATQLPPAAAAQEVQRFVQAVPFPEGVERPADFDAGQLAAWMEHTVTFFRLKAAINWKFVEKLPRDKVEAGAIEEANRLAAVPGAIPATITPAGLADWIKRCYAPDLSRDALRNACIGAEDMIDAFAKKVVLPLAASETGMPDVYVSQVHFDKAKEAAARVLCAGKAANAIFENSRHFHSQIAHIMEAGADEVTDAERRKREEEARRSAALNALGIDHAHIPPDGWPPLSAIVQAPNGVYIVPLTDPELLRMEGYRGVNPDGTEGLHHCVGGYAGTCRNGGHILSMREITPDGRTYVRLSTAEITPIVHGDRTLNVRQHHGKHNGQPPEKARRAFEWYREQVLNGAVVLNYEGIREHLGALGAKSDDVRKACDYEWRERPRIQKAMWPWGKYVGKRYRAMGLDEFAAEPEIQGVIDLINPQLVLRAR